MQTICIYKCFSNFKYNSICPPTQPLLNFSPAKGQNLSVNNSFSPIFAVHFNYRKNMQIIQTIRDKGAAVVIAVIAISLIGFLLMDAKPGSSTSFFGSSNNTIGKVNGESIDRGEFEKKVKYADDMGKQQAQQSGRPAPDLAQVREQVWNQMVAEKVFFKEAEKLGIDFTSKELSALLYGNDPSNPLMREQGIVDPATGKPDPSKVQQIIINIKKAKGVQADMANTQLAEQPQLTSVSSKYFALLNASAYYPTWMQEKNVKETKSFANISYVAVPYNVISDSTITVTDAEIEAYVAKHKNQFKQEAGRMISYVAFSQLPSADDSANAKGLVSNLKAGFAAETNMQAFIARNGSVIDFDSSYLPKSSIASVAIDSILKQPIGTVYGPYVDGGNYVLAKISGTKILPDSIKCRHILISTSDRQTGQPTTPDSIAKKSIDSIEVAIKSGANFDQLEAMYSTDEVAHKDKGVMTFSIANIQNKQQFAAEFGDFLLNEKGETKKKVKTNFGWHYIEILAKKNPAPAYKIAFMAKEILPSDVTINTANNNATKLSAQKGGKDLDAYVAKNGLQKITWPSIVKENDFNVGQLQDARQLVRWVFEAKTGDVSEPFTIGDQFVVATVDKIQSEGTQDAKTARAMVEGVVRNKKKATTIIAKLGATPTLESAAAAYSKQVETAGADSSITFGSQIIPNVGPEPKIIGASFNAAYQTKASAPIEGNNGVYIIKVNSIGAKAADTPETVAQQQKQQTDALRNQAAAGWFEGLKNQATIKDSRSKIY
jgi:peptidyl-prolyl cis-trans isomerase D